MNIFVHTDIYMYVNCVIQFFQVMLSFREIWALLNTGTERNIPEYAGMRRNDTGMKRNEQEWYRNIPKRAGMTPE